MFPPILAHDCFSLGAGQGPSPALSIWATLEPSGALADYGMTTSLVNSSRMTYQKVDEVLQQPDVATVQPTLHLLQQVCDLLSAATHPLAAHPLPPFPTVSQPQISTHDLRNFYIYIYIYYLYILFILGYSHHTPHSPSAAAGL